jgi:superfamily II DNA or RNA helicase
MKLRPYQTEFIDNSLKAFEENQRVLSCAATGAGKTIIASELMRREKGNCLFLADAEELIKQNADKFFKFTGEVAGVERGKSHAMLGVDRVVVATSQTLWRRLDRYPEDYFNLIIVDEAHRNTLGKMSERILEHFGEFSKVLGVTATPYRTDRKQLGDYYETLAVDIGLDRLIREGWLSRIMIKGVPLDIDLSAVRSSGGDYKASDLDAVIEPCLVKAAELLRETIREHNRKGTVVFLPLIKTSKRFVEILCAMGVRAVHVDGEDRSSLSLFESGKAEVVCNSALLSTGWDCPRVDCIYPLSPTKSLSLFSQRVGRGTRLYPEKDHLLLLDPLYLHETHRLITPASLVASDADEAAEIRKKIREGEECGAGFADLLKSEEEAEADREDSLRKQLEEAKKKDPRLVDALDFAISSGDLGTAEYQPTTRREEGEPTAKQLACLEKNGFNTDSIKTFGQASKLIDLLFTRREKGLATPKQLRILKRFKHPDPGAATFEEASDFIDKKLKGKDERFENTNPITALQMVKLKQIGIKPSDVKSRELAERILREARTPEEAEAIIAEQSEESEINS